MFRPPGAAAVAFIMSAGCLWIKGIRWTSLPAILWRDLLCETKGQRQIPSQLAPAHPSTDCPCIEPSVVWFEYSLHVPTDLGNLLKRERVTAVGLQSSVSVSGEYRNYCLRGCDVVCSDRQVPTFGIYLSLLNTAPLLGRRCSLYYFFEIQNYSICSF